MSESDDDSLQPQRTRAPPTTHHDDDDEFEFEQYSDAAASKASSQQPLKKTLDKPFDEVHEVSDSADDSHVDISPSASPTGKHQSAAAASAQRGGGRQQQQTFDSEDSVSMDSQPSPTKKSSKHHHKKEKESKKSKSSSSSSSSSHAHSGKPGNMAMSGKPGNVQPSKTKHEKSSSDEESESENEDQPTESGGSGQAKPGSAHLYNPAEYAHLNVSSEIQDLFEYITRHKPSDIELDTKLRPFIPDYIPAVGELDAFLKVPPPEPIKGAPALGLTVLDEPASHQSDPTVLELSLRAVNKQVIAKHTTVGTIEHAEKHSARVMKWIANIEEVHRKKPPPHVHYSRPMPDIESLMQVWPAEFEELLKLSEMPQVTNMDCNVEEFARMVCAIMDIPVYDGKITESLHVLFTLFAEFQNHAYFQH